MSPAPALARAARLLESPRVDQRLHRRYPIILDNEYRLLDKGRVERLGSGKTLNMSSGGVLFEAKEALPAGSLVELLMDWPFLLDGVCPLKLVIRARVVRSNRQLTAVHIVRYEFRTTGTRAPGNRPPADKVRSPMT